MNRQGIMSITIILLFGLLLTACGRGQEEEAPPPQPATSIPEPAQAPTQPPSEDASVEESSVEESSVEESAGSANVANPDQPPAFQAVETSSAVSTYSLAVEMDMNTPRGDMTMRMDGQFSKDPPAEDLRINAVQGGETQIIQSRLVDGVRYFRTSESDQWVQIPRFNLSEMIVLEPESLTEIQPNMTVIGSETVSGRQTIHLRATKEDLPDVIQGGEEMDLRDVDAAQLDIWVDSADNFIVQIEMTVEEDEQLAQMRFLYADFNQPVEIVAPSAGEILQFEEPTAIPASDVTAMLGFDFPMPPETTITIFGQTANLITPLELTAARTLLEETMAANGFSPTGDPDEPSPNEYYYTFSNGDRTINIAVFSMSPGITTIQINALR